MLRFSKLGWRGKKAGDWEVFLGGILWLLLVAQSAQASPSIAGDKAIFSAVNQLASDDPLRVEEARIFLQTLGASPPGVRAWLSNRARSPDPRLRIAAALAIRELESPHGGSLVGDLLQLLADTDPAVRAVASRSLYQGFRLDLGDPQMRGTLESALQVPAAPIRAAAVRLLGEQGGRHPDLIPEVLRLIVDPSGDVASEAIRIATIFRQQDEAVQLAVLRALCHAEGTRGRAIDYFSRIILVDKELAPKTGEAILSESRTSDGRLRDVLIGFLGDWVESGRANVPAMERLVEALSDSNGHIRYEATQSLQALADTLGPGSRLKAVLEAKLVPSADVKPPLDRKDLDEILSLLPKAAEIRCEELIARLR